MGDFDDLIPEYITESAELLDTVENGLLRMEEGDYEPEVVHTIFRAIHSIKGGAGFVGLEKIERLAHRMEDLLNLIRNGDLTPNHTITDALLKGLDVLSALFQRVDEHDQIDVNEPIAALQAALSGDVSEEVAAQVAAPGRPKEDTGLPAFEVSEYSIRKKLAQGNLFLVTMDLAALENRGLTPTKALEEMISMGEVLDAQVRLPNSQSDEEYRPVFDLLYATVLEEDLVAASLQLDDQDCRQLTIDDFELSQDSNGEQTATLPAPAAVPAPAPEPEPPVAPAPAPQAPAAAPAPSPPPSPKPAAAPARPKPAAPAEPKPAPAPAPAAPPPAAQPAPAPAREQRPEPEPEPEEPESWAGEYLTFHLGEELYGVDVLDVQEIIAMPQVARLPNSPEHVLGVTNLRGMVVPVIDLRLRLGLPVEKKDPVVVVVRVGEMVMGSVVDGVSDVVPLEDGQIQDPPAFAGAVRREFLRGLVRQEEEMLILLELDRLLAISGGAQ